MSKVFGIGLSRTGTMSLTKALGLLGYKAVHFPADQITQAEFYPFFASKHESVNLTVLKSCDAITDTPVCCLYKALDVSYPGSKFILTIRTKDSWLRSCERYWRYILGPALEGDPDVARRNYIDFINEKVYGSCLFDWKRFSEVYDTYHAEAFEHFKARRTELLRLDICGGEGWSQLAPFLGATIPEIPFPHENRLATSERL